MPGKTSQVQHLIIDTNVFQNFSNKELAIHITNDITEAMNLGYVLAMSDFSYFELINSATVEKERERMNAIGSLKKFRVNRKVLISAAHLGCLYQDDQHTISDEGDKIIAATAVLTGSMIYTFNRRDFPSPFFTTVATRYAEYANRGVPCVLPAFFLKPEIDFMAKKYKERTYSDKQKLNIEKIKSKMSRR